MDEQRSSRRISSALYAPMALILLFLAAVVFVSLFFRVTILQVENDTVYTDEEIIAASGLERGVNLFFVNNFKAVSSIYASMPYVESVNLKRAMPNRVIISVSGSDAVACVSFGGDYWLINPNCKLLEKIDAKEARSFIRVENMEPLQPVAGEIMNVSAADTGKDVFLRELLSLFQDMGMTSRINWVDLEDLNHPVFSYEDRYEVHLGSSQELGRRLALVRSAIEQLADGDAGTLELEESGSSNRVYFSPD